MGLRVNDRASASGSRGAHAGSVLLRGPAEEAGARARGRVTVLGWPSGDARDGPDAWERAVLRLAGLPCGTTLSGRGRSVGRGERWWRLLGQREWFCGLSCRGKKGAGPRWAVRGGKRNQDEMVWAEVEFEPMLGWAWVFLFFYFLCFSNSNHSTNSIQKQIQIQP